MKTFFLTLSLLLSLSVWNHAQENAKQTLGFYSDAMVHCVQADNRIKAHDKFYQTIHSFLTEEHSFQQNLSFLEAVSVQMPQDSSFKIISWQLKESDDTFRYFCFLQMQDGSLYEWQDQQDPISDLEYEIFDPGYWYGALYYNLENIGRASGEYYLLYGFAQLDQYTRQKILDVLWFKEGKPMLGKGIFVKDRGEARPDIKNRLELQYSADAGVTLNFNPEMDMIIFDHLVAQAGRIPGQGIALYPDGTYEGYERKEDQWHYKEKIFDAILDEAPRPKPVLGDKRKGLFGQDKKGK